MTSSEMEQGTPTGDAFDGDGSTGAEVANLVLDWRFS